MDQTWLSSIVTLVEYRVIGLNMTIVLVTFTGYQVYGSNRLSCIVKLIEYRVYASLLVEYRDLHDYPL